MRENARTHRVVTQQGAPKHKYRVQDAKAHSQQIRLELLHSGIDYSKHMPWLRFERRHDDRQN